MRWLPLALIGFFIGLHLHLRSVPQVPGNICSAAGSTFILTEGQITQCGAIKLATVSKLLSIEVLPGGALLVQKGVVQADFNESAEPLKLVSGGKRIEVKGRGTLALQGLEKNLFIQSRGYFELSPNSATKDLEWLVVEGEVKSTFKGLVNQALTAGGYMGPSGTVQWSDFTLGAFLPFILNPNKIIQLEPYFTLMKPQEEKVFRWTSVEPDQKAFLEIYSQMTGELLVKTESFTQSARLKTPPVGDYFWQVKQANYSSPRGRILVRE